MKLLSFEVRLLSFRVMLLSFRVRLLSFWMLVLLGLLVTGFLPGSAFLSS